MLIQGRSKSFLAAEAIEYYLAMHSWQVKTIEKSVKKANSKKDRFIQHEKVAHWLNSWKVARTGTAQMIIRWLNDVIHDLQTLRQYIGLR